jgi:kynurenine formamidase
MIYDLSQPLFNNAPQFPGQPANSVRYAQRAAVSAATVERLELMTHSGTHIDAPFHFFPQLPSVSELPLSHFYGPCVAIDLRPLQPAEGITSEHLKPHQHLLNEEIFVLIKTGWGDDRNNSTRFLTQWPWITGDAANYLVSRGVKGLGIDGLSTGGYGDEHVEGDAHKELLSHGKLLLEDIHIPDALLDSRVRRFQAFPILIANVSGAWTRCLVWDPGDLDGNSPAPEQPAAIPESVARLLELERGR